MNWKKLQKHKSGIKKIKKFNTGAGAIGALAVGAVAFGALAILCTFESWMLPKGNEITGILYRCSPARMSLGLLEIIFKCEIVLLLVTKKFHRYSNFSLRLLMLCSLDQQGHKIISGEIIFRKSKNAKS